METTIIRLETRKISRKLIDMLKLVQKNHELASEAIQNNDVTLAKKILENDKKVDEKFYEIESDIEFMIVKTPLDRDLRRTLASLHIADEIERIGDYAKHIAKFIINTEKVATSSIKRILGVHKLFSDMVSQLLVVLEQEKLEPATKLAHDDKAVDALVQSVRKEIITSLTNKSLPSEVEERIYVLNIVNALERAADHVVIICELIAYINTGQHTSFF